MSKLAQCIQLLLDAEKSGNLPETEDLQKFLNQTHKSQILQRIETMKLDGAKEFKAKDFFATKNEDVKISYIGDRFTNRFINKVEKDVESADIKFHKLLKASLDVAILSEIGSEHEIKLAHLAGILKLQSSGQKGVLLTNGLANIFYIKDTKEMLWAVRVRWLGDGWDVSAFSVDDSRGWDGAYLVCSR